MEARGIRNNNPFNIKISDTKWQNKIVPSKDPVFETFSSPEYGIRAGVKILLSDSDAGRNTVHLILARFAPETENNLEAYEKAVCERLKVSSNTVLDLDDYEIMYALTSAIILHENGSIPYSDSIINKGITMAGVYNVPRKPLTQEPETHAAVGAGALATVTAAGGAVQAVSPAIPLLQDAIHLAPWLIAVALGCAAAYFGYLVYKKYHTGI